jgi:hypothetical protein
MINSAGWASLKVIQNQLGEFVKNDLVSEFWVQNHYLEDQRGVVHEKSAPQKRQKVEYLHEKSLEKLILVEYLQQRTQIESSRK